MTITYPQKKPVGLNNPTQPSTDKLRLKPELPPGWDLDRIQRILANYEPQQQNPLGNRDQTASKGFNKNLIEVPDELVPTVQELIEKYKAA